ncbi:MAG TPA: M23 family metallopeptidase [Chlorobiota bacterium]|nr:M23 family metallopeptidase [Chlorobiota bacterium]
MILPRRTHCLCAIGSSVIWFAVTVVLATQSLAQVPSMVLPVDGVLNRDVFLVNHVDHDVLSTDVRDYMCGVRTYDGHQGTDFVLRSFRQMDSGVAVRAALPGVVIAVVDTLFDRNKVSVVERGFGNYISIAHNGGWYTNYAHLKTNSARVNVGDRVVAGDHIADVGSSGNSSDPHLHFEVWQNIDPFLGTCGGLTSLWKSQPGYDTEFLLIDADVSCVAPLLDTLRERPAATTVVTELDSIVTFWALVRNVIEGDVLRVEWTTSAGDPWFAFESTMSAPSAYMYWWTWINRPTVPGEYLATFMKNGVVVTQRTFLVPDVVGVPIADANDAGIHLSSDGTVVTIAGQSERVHNISWYSRDGRLISSSMDIGQVSVLIPTDAHIIVVTAGNRRCSAVIR